MSQRKYKHMITDNISDAREIVRMVGRGIEQGKIDVPSALQNLAEAVRKLQSAQDLVDRE